MGRLVLAIGIEPSFVCGGGESKRPDRLSLADVIDPRFQDVDNVFSPNFY